MLGLYFRIRSGVVRQSLWPSRYSRQLSGTRNHNNSALIFFPSQVLSSRLNLRQQPATSSPSLASPSARIRQVRCSWTIASPIQEPSCPNQEPSCPIPALFSPSPSKIFRPARRR